MGNSLNTDLRCHANVAISNQVALSSSITTAETLVWWVEAVTGDMEELNRPAMTQYINAFKYSKSMSV